MKQITVSITLWVPDEATEADCLDWLEDVICASPDVIEVVQVPLLSTEVH